MYIYGPIYFLLADLDTLCNLTVYLLHHFMQSFSDMLSTTYATSFLFVLGIVIVSLNFNAAEMNFRLIQIL